MKTELLSRTNLNKLPQGEHPDGQGLWLVVHPGGSRSWKLNYSFAGKPQKMGLGSLVLVSLEEARTEATKIRLGLRQNPPVDPKAAREAAPAPQGEAASNVISFGEFAAKRIPIIVSGLKHKTSVEAWTKTFPKKIAPIAAMPITEIETSHIEALVLPIWIAKPSAGRALLNRMARIFRAAKQLKIRTGENPAAFRENLSDLLPVNKKVGHVRGPQKSLDYRQIGAFVAGPLAERDSQSASALQLLILTAARTSEIAGMRWSEIDEEQALWMLPGKRMKNNMPAIIPLSQPALDLLATVKRAGLCDTFVFPGVKPGKPMHVNTMRTLVQREMGRLDITIHGFRSTFRTWGLEETEHSDQMLEFCLHHIKGDNAKTAYLRGTAVEKRRRIMRDWAAFVMSKNKPVKQRPPLQLVA